MTTVSGVEHNLSLKLRMKLINPIMKVMIRRGWGPMAKELMILHWTGKKSGKAYSTPVSRFELDGQLFTQTKSGFKANFVGGGPAELVLEGERAPYIGTVVDDPAVVGQRMRTILDSMGNKQGARALGLKIDGEPSLEQLVEVAAAERCVVIEFQSV